MFLGADSVLGTIGLYRLCWIGGKFGGHKTSLAFAIAETFLRRGYRLITNSRCVWADNPRDVTLNEDGKLKAIVILDEGGLEFKSTTQVEQLVAYAAKMDCIYIIPSFFPPVRTAQVMTIQPLYGLKSAGIPLVLYRWRTKLGGFEDKGHFWWWNPSSIYGIYSRQDPGARTTAIAQLLLERKDEYRKLWGHDDANIDDISALAVPTEADIIREAADQMAEAADSFTAFSVRKYKRR